MSPRWLVIDAVLLVFSSWTKLAVNAALEHYESKPATKCHVMLEEQMLYEKWNKENCFPSFPSVFIVDLNILSLMQKNVNVPT